MGKNIGSMDDQMGKLNGSVIFYKGVPYFCLFDLDRNTGRRYVLNLYDEFGKLIHQDVKHTDDEFVYKHDHRLNFVNVTRSGVMSALLLTRIAGQGCYGYNAHDYMTLDPFKSPEGIMKHDLVRHFKDKFPTWQHALAKVTTEGASSVAFDNSFALKKLSAFNVGVYHMRTMIGTINTRVKGSDPKLSPIDSPVLSFFIAKLKTNGHQTILQ